LDELPLAGLTFAIKDVFVVRHIPTTNCCHAYTAPYGNASNTAPATETLIKQGAIPIEKVKTIQFFSGTHVMD
jgi:Asp-tRNA(Asn)/Glu-tRNA(Gln) amidotransferase A subunit family amidase